MLQAAVAIGHRIEHEQVGRMGRRVGGSGASLAAVPEPNSGLANGLGVGQQPCTIKAGRGSGHHETVGDTAGCEITGPEVTHLYRAVHQLVVVGRAVAAKSLAADLDRREAGGHLPARQARGSDQVQLMRRILLAMHLQKKASAVEEAALRVKPGGAHRVVQGVNLIAQHQRLVGSAVGLPTAFVQLGQLDCLPALLALQPLQVLGEFTHQVAARDPDRKTEGLQRLRLGNRQGHLVKMSVQVRQPDLVADGCHGVAVLVSLRCFSTSAAPMAPGTREPSANTRVGVPVILNLRPTSRLRAIALASQLAAAGV